MRYKTPIRKFKIFYSGSATHEKSVTLQELLKITDFTNEEVEKIISLKPGCTMRFGLALSVRREKGNRP